MPKNTRAQRSVNHSYKINEDTRQRIAHSVALLGTSPSLLTQEVMALFLDEFDSIKPTLIQINRAMLNTVLQKLIERRGVFYGAMEQPAVIRLYSTDDSEEEIINKVDQLCATTNTEISS